MHFEISEKPTMDAYRYIITLASSLKYLKVQIAKTLKIAVLDNPTVV